ncbi:unnamed protein product [Protopolystoma xenopodis]|uniref:Uncharacterized protein n=1 Tax=Protopolystoma xenopodis TaxID=117903 RepID=A0A3S5B5Y8_9PLAT|nr:unnamed protein product [Protopolystoma xenopodis]
MCQCTNTWQAHAVPAQLLSESRLALETALPSGPVQFGTKWFCGFVKSQLPTPLPTSTWYSFRGSWRSSPRTSRVNAQPLEPGPLCAARLLP